MFKSNYILRYSIMALLLVFTQVMLFNKLSFLNYGTPFIYIYLIIKLPISLNRSLQTIIGFLLGFVIDIFCNTPGINAAATTFIAFMRRPIQGLFFLVDDFDEEIPRLSSQRGVFMKSVIVMTLLHHLALILLESFSTFNAMDILLRTLASTILTSILILSLEGFSLKRNDS